MERTIGTWLSGLLASAVLGGWVGAFIGQALHASIHELFGLVGGMCTFTCIRLWLGQEKSRPLSGPANSSG